jgi:3-dehydroquinate synthase
LSQLCDKSNTILVTDEMVYASHASKFKGWKTIVIKAGEANKQQAAVDAIIQQLMTHEADRTTTLVGVGGGVVTDITGYAGAIYMRGIRTGFVPTTLLAMVDAAIGGKNGVDAGIYKNLIGTIRQPSFLLYDTSLLESLPELEWQNGFAEIIKHAAILDRKMFVELQSHDLPYYRKNKKAMSQLVTHNALLKTKVVRKDPTEKGIRKLLNFGHTLGHAIENDLQISHGYAVAVGMVYAAHLSANLKGFREVLELVETIEQYGLPTHASFSMEQALHNMRHDKKRQRDTIHYVLLEKLGKAVIDPIAFKKLEQLLLHTSQQIHS